MEYSYCEHSKIKFDNVFSYHHSNLVYQFLWWYSESLTLTAS